MPADVKRSVSMLDLSAQHTPIRDEILATITGLIDAQDFVMGEEIRLLEQEIAAHCSVAHGVGCASGSDALYLALQAAGVGPGDQVITTPFTFFASAGSITRTGARPVFCDIEPLTFNMDPSLLAAMLPERPKVKVVMPVHLFGACADMDPILETCRSRGCFVLEDAAQSIGAEYKGRRALGLADAAGLSFFPSKNLGAMGDAGMVTSNDEAFAAKVAKLRVHGETKQYHHRWVGTNSRMDNLQAAILRVKLRYLDEWTAIRRENADRYRANLSGEGLPITLPATFDYQTRHVYNQFVIRCERRDELRAHLADRGVDSAVYYPIPLHRQECFLDLGYAEGSFPVSEQATREVLALPVAPGTSGEDVDYVCDLIRRFYG